MIKNLEEKPDRDGYTMFEKLKGLDKALKVEREYSTEFLVADKDENCWSVVINQDELTDCGEIPRSGVASHVNDCAEGKKEYEWLEIQEFYAMVGKKTVKNEMHKEIV